MTPRSAGAAFGLLAFSCAILAGLWAGNPAMLILQRALWAMVLFCLIGLCAGWAGRVVVREHARRREESLFSGTEATSDQSAADVAGNKATVVRPEPMRT